MVSQKKKKEKKIVSKFVRQYTWMFYSKKFFTGACMEKKQRIVTDQNCGSETTRVR